MPEGDTVFRTADKLRAALVGQTLTRCDVRVPRYATVDLSGRVVDEVRSRGKHLFIRVGPASIHSHLKMDGAWRITSKTRRVDYRVRIILETTEIRAIGIDLGILQILERDHDDEVVEHLGPDLLGEDWDAVKAADNLVADPGRSIAEALLDQRVMAGIGNVFCNELCFVSGYLPTAPVSAIGDPHRLAVRARDMLWVNRLRRTRCTTGDARPGRQFWVYGRRAENCRRCESPISYDDSGERMAYWCPACQR